MVLVDTSIWIAHFRKGVPHLEELLLDTRVAIHSFVIGEIACGNLRNRIEILSLLNALPHAKYAENKEILDFIEDKKLMGIGIGFIDAHLLASSLLSNIPLWTLDKALESAASKLKIHYKIV